MFVDFHNRWPPPEPWEPPPPPRITPRGERLVAWIIGLNLLMLVFGPLAGATLIDAILKMARG